MLFMAVGACAGSTSGGLKVIRGVLGFKRPGFSLLLSDK